MKSDIEGLAGYVAEQFVFCHLQANGQAHNVCKFSGTDIDMRIKIDYAWLNRHGQLKYGDCKGSIMHENVSVEADHPFFRQTVRGIYFFLFPFRDARSIAIVEAHALYRQVLANKQPYRGFKRDYYVVSPADVSSIDKDSVTLIPVVEGCKTFGDFFKRNFRGDELASLSENEIWCYVNNEVAGICRKSIIDYDIPED